MRLLKYCRKRRQNGRLHHNINEHTMENHTHTLKDKQYVATAFLLLKTSCVMVAWKLGKDVLDKSLGYIRPGGSKIELIRLST